MVCGQGAPSGHHPAAAGDVSRPLSVTGRLHKADCVGPADRRHPIRPRPRPRHRLRPRLGTAAYPYKSSVVITTSDLCIYSKCIHMLGPHPGLAGGGLSPVSSGHESAISARRRGGRRRWLSTGVRRRRSPLNAAERPLTPAGSAPRGDINEPVTLTAPHRPPPAARRSALFRD